MTDLISRQAEIDAIVEFTHMDWDSLKILYPMLEVIDNLPSAEPKHGKWVKADRQQYFRKHYPASQCSICGWRKNYSGEYNYCPNCGADMGESK